MVKKTKTGYFLGANGINEMIMNIVTEKQLQWSDVYGTQTGEG